MNLLKLILFFFFMCGSDCGISRDDLLPVCGRAQKSERGREADTLLKKWWAGDESTPEWRIVLKCDLK